MAIARNQIDDILLFSRRWGGQQLRIEDASASEKNQENQRTIQHQVEYAAREMREKKEVRNFKCDSSQYMRTSGFTPGMGKGKGGM